MDRASLSPVFFHFRPPYRALSPAVLPEWSHFRAPQGEMLVWKVESPLSGEAFEAARSRPPGVALVVVLPPAEAVPKTGDFLRIIELCRPHSVLPHHTNPNPLDLEALLRRQPDDLGSEVMEYLVWRGIILDHETRHVVRRTLELSGDLRTVTSLSRSLYLSRRALGRRFLDRGIPVPSHWLHFGRVLRACVLLQSQKCSLFDVACDLGYPDGFALSNQMSRLIGVRPSVAREYLGWEWLMESWLRRELSTGGFTGEHASVLSLYGEASPPSPQESRKLRRAASRSRKDGELPTLRVQEG